jgi:hypothetical protein
MYLAVVIYGVIAFFNQYFYSRKSLKDVNTWNSRRLFWLTAGCAEADSVNRICWVSPSRLSQVNSEDQHHAPSGYWREDFTCLAWGKFGRPLLAPLSLHGRDLPRNIAVRDR